ncbi:DUF2157 domain-containing protein [Pantoea sp. S61]|uniref:DUF2157 domain-containing protein n=1 Tax=Pantoea sp. S61 TaxID=2767442 RepID=UPI00190A5D38|nr:DUF2157 domain-containing protein [Pantoea sp. S61]MBK0122291.1 DUF2157 domain-containing protein [Pantoea sp. S61]MBK0123000.1 DUF2157 domain-containing protein [Pantoea sp. S61]
MRVTRKQEKIIRQALAQWQQERAITDEDHQRLAGTITRVVFDWRRLSQYAFWTALACIVIAFGSLFSDSDLLAQILAWFAYSSVARIGLPLFLAIVFFGWGFTRQQQEKQWHYSTEAILFLGVLSSAIALWQIGEMLDNGSGNIAPLFLAGSLLYGLIGYFGRSGLVWLFFLLSLANAFGAETGYMSGWGAYWLGMNYPIRFIFFGAGLLLLCFLLQPMLIKRHLFTVSKVMGLTCLFIALWIMSIFGNYDIDNWYDTSRLTLLPWALLFALASGVCISIGLKTDDSMLRRFGITFLAINLYTRYFEYFWDGLHKVVFFLVLAASLALIGRYAEKIWHLGEREMSE